MTIRSKLLLGYGAVLALVAVSLAAMFVVDRIRATHVEQVEQQQQLADGSRVLGRYLRDEIIFGLGIALYPDLRATLLVGSETARQAADATLAEMMAAPLTPEGRALVTDIEATHAQLSAAHDRVVALLETGDTPAALEALVAEVAPLTSRVLAQADAFRDVTIAAVASLRARLDEQVRATSIALLGLAVFVLALGLAIALRLAGTITRQLRDGVDHLASASTQILATTAQVASSAAQNATAVSETTATVEEVKQTSQVASQKARQVSDRAQAMAEVAQDGRDAVEETIRGMHHIQAQMESLASRIQQLSEQNYAIGEIMAIVDDLAEQSNLLAVNAAIEATRAGEHGRGFAVVAQEVKSLAVQSKQATRQVRNILGEIQKATAGAVQATEEGSRAVDVGAERSAAAREAIGALAESVQQAAQAATHIAVSNKQQMVGMDQVAQAMDEIKKGSAQNLAGARQAEAAAHALTELGTALGSLIGTRGRNGSSRNSTGTSGGTSQGTRAADAGR